MHVSLEPNTVEPFGAHGYLVTPKAGDVLGLYRAIRRVYASSATDIVPGAHAVLLVMRPDESADLHEALTFLPPDAAEELLQRTIALPVIYDGADLVAVADLLGVSVTYLVALHTSAVYTARFTGFAPGFTYLTGLPASLAAISRRDTPRTHVSAGSVAVGGGYTAVYPASSPGGWHLLGHCPTTLFTSDGALLQPGDLIRFRPIRGR